MLSEHDGLVDIKLCIPPAIPAESCFVARTMSNEFLFCPVHLICNLWQEGSAAISFTYIDAMTMQLKLIETLDAAHGGKDGNLDVDVIKLFAAKRRKSWIFKSSGTRHLCHNFRQGEILAEMSNAAT